MAKQSTQETSAGRAKTPSPSKHEPAAAPKRDVEGASSSSAAGLRWIAVLCFAPVIFLGAFLLFAVQPLIARFLLPWFGGTPAVWTTCLLFFQTLLLGGYAYAHLSVTYLPARMQVLLHLALLGAALFVPIVPSAVWKPQPDQDPVWRIILILSSTIGLPYLVLSGTSPLLQAWFVKATGGSSPYRLFALSNFGSLLALLAYPFLIEPNWTRVEQAGMWRSGLIAFAILCTACAALVWRSGTSRPATKPQDEENIVEPLVLALTRFLWLALPCVASVLLLAITNTICQDVAVVPFLWVVPLSIYLITFIIAFDSPRWYLRRGIAVLLPLCMIWVILALHWVGIDLGLMEQLIGYNVTLFVACLFCHGELALLRPGTRHLTQYYLMIALGGALGGVFVAVLAPHLFNRFFELPLGLLACGIFAMVCFRIRPPPGGLRWAAATPLIGLILLATQIKGSSTADSRVVVRRLRNFYGILSVVQNDDPDERKVERLLMHGRIVHGWQALDPEMRMVPRSYYAAGSGIARAFNSLPGANRRIGIIGLGAGALAAYGRAGDQFRYYEIDPDVEFVARKDFTYLRETPAKVDVILGDGRLSLEREPPQNFDLLVLDAFSGDAIPAHLLTKEAFDIYQRHLKPGGLLAVHITNRYVDLHPILFHLAERFNLTASSFSQSGSIWVLMTKDKSFMERPEIAEAKQSLKPGDPRIKLWTDDQTSLLRLLKF